MMDQSAPKYRSTLASARTLALAATVGSMFWLSTAHAQNARPEPAPPINRAADPGALAKAQDEETPADRPAPAANEARQASDEQPANGAANGTPMRRPTDATKVPFTFKDAPIEETFSWIAETTGKVIIPLNLAQLRTKKITVINDEPIDKQTALDLLFQAFRLSQVAVFEKPDVIIIDVLTNLPANIPPVIPASEDIMQRTERGAIVIKIFQVKKTAASTIHDMINNTMLPDYATLSVDENSNRLAVMADIGFCQEVQRLINELDVPPVETVTETFYLKYVSADAIYNNIMDVFGDGPLVSVGGGGGAANNARNSRVTGANRGVPNQGRQVTITGQGVRPTADLRVTTNTQINSVTVAGETSVVHDIGGLIHDHWDKPLRPEITRLYTLKYTDPIKVRDLLQALLEQGGSTSTNRAAAGQRPGLNQPGQANASASVQGVYRIEAYPDSNTLIVMAKTEESFPFLDSMIEAIDKPIDIGMPDVVELKNAEAEEVANLLNVLLSEAGSGMTLESRATGLSGSVGSQIGSEGSTGGGATGGSTGSPTELRFPWQSGRQRDDQSPETPLIGKVRIVPVSRNNSIVIVAPNEYREAVRNLIIDKFDRASRQVLITAVIAEIQLTDALALGLRYSNSDAILSPSRPDAAIGGNVSGSAGRENFFNLFDTSVLDINISVNVLLQMLAQQNRIRVLQQPSVFTSENQEAEFFTGQDVPFINNSNVTDVGGVTQSFDYKPVGVRLDVRPRITVEGHVEMEIDLELSSIVPGETLFGGFILDRRQTKSRITVKNGQTVVLSGILTQQESTIRRRIPILGDIPLIGELFTSRDNETTNSELFAFITPTVVNHPDENDTNYNAEDLKTLEKFELPIKKHVPATIDERLDRLVPVEKTTQPEQQPE